MPRLSGLPPAALSADAPLHSRMLACLILLLTYLIAGRLGLMLAVPPGYATAIFPPAGIAIAAMFIGGGFTLPWTFVGSVLLNIWVGAAGHGIAQAIYSALLIAIASTIQAASGGIALRRLIGHPAGLDTVRDVSIFFLTAPLLCLISASLSIACLSAAGVVPAADIAISWLTWWMGDTLGLLMFLPLVMVVAGEPRAAWRVRAYTVALPMLLFFALFVVVFVKIDRWENQESLLEFRLQTERLLDSFRAQLTAQDVFLAQLKVSFNGPAKLSLADFAARADILLERQTAIQAIEWAPRVSEADRAEHFPVTFVEPLTGNEPALGFDLTSEPKRAAAIERAFATGNTTTSAPISLVQEQTERTGVLLVSAVSSGPNGPGVVLIVLRMPTLMQALLGTASSDLGVAVSDQDGGLLFRNGPTAINGPVGGQDVAFGGRTYRIRTTTTPFYLAAHRGWQSWALLTMGVLGTSLLGALLLLATGERQRFTRLVSELTRERDRIWQVSEDLLGVGDLVGYFLSVNPAWTRTLGWSETEIKAMHVNELRHPDDFETGMAGRRHLSEGAGTVRMENRFRHKNGSYRWIYWTMTAEQELIYLIGRDVTADHEAARAHRETEEQLRQLQKMESVGQLTGGIAHDFNNLLTIIIGNLELLERLLGSPSGRVRRALTSAMTGATRAATLTQRLLAYAQRQPLRPHTVDLNELVSGMADLMRRTQGETINYVFALREPSPCCFCDANQLETALLNLVINARDAMPAGGRIEIATGEAVFDAAAARQHGIAAGDYALLSVTDTGAGMAPDTAARAFEPFFTTKPIGKGTGLGLSMVYGFVKQSKGHVEIDSKIDSGTSVRIYLPSIRAEATGTAANEDARRAPSGGQETILVVEDDAEVRLYVAQTLRDLNYLVVEASSGDAALAALRQSALHVDLLLTDVVMPGMDGRQLALRARALRPHIKLLLMTGYSFTGGQQGHVDLALLPKPFHREVLAARVREALHPGEPTRADRDNVAC
jgi:PAS domain S-box-containing protein